jgi:23S rRNA G2445 N2-methylase RlmL
LDVARKNAKFLGADIEFFQGVYANQLTEEPNIIVADMPYGDRHYALESNPESRLKHLPVQSVWHPAGLLKAYVELLNSVRNRGWHPKMFLETGKIPEGMVRSAFAPPLRYNQLAKDYSVTEIVL